MLYFDFGNEWGNNQDPMLNFGLRMTRSVTLLHIEPDLAAAEFARGQIIRLPNLRYLGAVTTGARGMIACRNLEPDLVLLELQLRDMDGIKFVEDLTRLPKAPRVILFTMRSDDFMLYFSQFQAISGIVWKTQGGLSELLMAITEVIADRTFFPPEYKIAMHHLRTQTDAFFKLLSNREQKLIPYLGRGETDEENAQHFGVKPGTVHAQRQSIMNKLNLHRQTEVMRWAIEKGFVDIPHSAPPCDLTTN